MSESPLVSVLMTVFNRERFISAAIESVINSTYQNWELIIVDDQSKDNSVAIAKRYAQKESRIKIYINDKNLGDYPNRNCAASYAKGKYLKYLDADDLLYPYGLEQLVYHMEKFPDAGYGLCSLEQDESKIFPFTCTPSEAYHRHYFIKPLFHKAPLSSIIKKDVFETVQGFKSIRMAGDFEMWHRLSITYSVVLMPHGIVWYRKHDNQEMNSYKDYYLNYLNITRDYISNPLCPLSEPERNKVLKKTNRSESRFIIKELMKGKKGINYLRKANTSLPKVILNSFS